MQLDKNTQIINILPPNEGEVTDEENIEDEELVRDIAATLEVCGEMEF